MWTSGRLLSQLWKIRQIEKGDEDMAASSQWEPCPTSTHFIAPPRAAFAFVQIEFLPRILEKIHTDKYYHIKKRHPSFLDARWRVRHQLMFLRFDKDLMKIWQRFDNCDDHEHCQYYL